MTIPHPMSLSLLGEPEGVITHRVLIHKNINIFKIAEFVTITGRVLLLDVYYVTDVIIKISVRDVIIKRFLRSIQ